MASSATEKTMREKLIEAGARAIWRRHHPGNWALEQQNRTGSYLKADHDARAALDAVLDTLSENAGDWRNEARVAWMEDRYGNEKTISALIAALRATDTRPEEK